MKKDKKHEILNNGISSLINNIPDYINLDDSIEKSLEKLNEFLITFCKSIENQLDNLD